MNKYTGLAKIAYAPELRMQKQAVFDNYARWRDENPWKSTAGYFIPGVGTGMAMADAVHDFSKGKILSGLGNVAFGALSLIPGVGLLKNLFRGGRAAAMAAKGAKGIGRAGTLKNLGFFNRWTSRGMSHLPGVANWGNKPWMHNALRTGNKMVAPISAHSGKLMLGGLGLPMLGAVREARQGAGQQMAGYAGQGMMQGMAQGMGPGAGYAMQGATRNPYSRGPATLADNPYNNYYYA